jgi:hypothetical protein
MPMFVLTTPDQSIRADRHYMVVSEHSEPGDAAAGLYIEHFGSDFDAALKRRSELYGRPSGPASHPVMIYVQWGPMDSLLVGLGKQGEEWPAHLEFMGRVAANHLPDLLEVVRMFRPAAPLTSKVTMARHRSLRDALKNGDCVSEGPTEPEPEEAPDRGDHNARAIRDWSPTPDPGF